MAKDYCSINFAGLTHDHSLLGPIEADPQLNGAAEHEPDDESLCSAISILKRHPMYDCLVLVKKYRNCLGGYSLEFPIDRVRETERTPTNESAHHNQQEQSDEANTKAAGTTTTTTTQALGAGGSGKCCRRRLVTRFLDGDDPMNRNAFLALRNSSSISLASSELSGGSPRRTSGQEETLSTANPADRTSTSTPDEAAATAAAAASQVDDLGQQCALVHVPINGLLDRLECYSRSGVAVDGRVYAFAMGLKTTERMMTTKSMKELHETPI